MLMSSIEFIERLGEGENLASIAERFARRRAAELGKRPDWDGDEGLTPFEIWFYSDSGFLERGDIDTPYRWRRYLRRSGRTVVASPTPNFGAPARIASRLKLAARWP
jgi:hypothetical protein